MNRTYDAGGNIIQETLYCSNRFDEMELRSTETYFYDENGVLELDVRWEWLYGRLSGGYYRIVKSVNEKEYSVQV